MGVKRDPIFFWWYLCRYWRHPGDLCISTKYENRQIACFLLLILTMYENCCYKALIISLFFASMTIVTSATGVAVFADRLCHAHLHGVHARLTSLYHVTVLLADRWATCHMPSTSFATVSEDTRHIVNVAHLTDLSISLIDVMESCHWCLIDKHLLYTHALARWQVVTLGSVSAHKLHSEFTQKTLFWCKS